MFTAIILLLLVAFIYTTLGAAYYDFNYSWGDREEKSALWHTYAAGVGMILTGIAGYMIGTQRRKNK